MTYEEHEKMFIEHWKGYTYPLLDIAMANTGKQFTDPQWEIVKILCLTHWIHGAKHEREGA